jgi:Xaa-Pro aminopeptidase
MNEIDEKVDRLARLATRRALGGILLNTQANFAWLSGGRSNQIDGSREHGAGSLLVTARGERFVVANNIEMPRLQEEALAGLGFAPCEYAWTLEHADRATAVLMAKKAVHGDIGCDTPLPGAIPIEGDINDSRVMLTPAEIDRYRALGRDLGAILGEVCRSLVPNLSEIEIAHRVASAAACVGARAIVTLVAADDRIARFRHPVPTTKTWRKQVMVVLGAQRQGLVAALSRIVSAEPIPDTLRHRTEAAAAVFGRLLTATIAGTSGADLYNTAAAAYADSGFRDEETRHHQGGAIGYRARDWIAHPESRERVQPRQAFAWNPSITGTKVEETMVICDGALNVVTSSPDWPCIPVESRGVTIAAPAVLRL